MPFTPCHIAAVYPLRRRLPLLPLGIGSMMPDLMYYIPLQNPYFQESAHTLTRSLTFCLPVGLIIYFFIMKTQQGWKTLLPKQLRIEPCRPTLTVVSVSIVIGSLTHIFWDAWTHRTGIFVQQFPSIPFKLLQHSSTALGGLFLLYIFVRRFGMRLFFSMYGLFWSSSIAVCLLVAFLNLRNSNVDTLDLDRSYFMLLTSSIGWWLLFLTVISLLLTLLYKISPD